MTWSSRMAEGVALAATALGDSGAARAAEGLCAIVRKQALHEAQRVAKLERGLRHQWLRERLRALRDRPIAAEPHAAPPRALGLLAASVPRELGRRFLERSPLPRAGYVADPRLVALLRERLSTRSEPT